MDLNSFDLEDLILAAIKSEVESRNVYSKLARQTKNGLLKDKMKFLAGEELKHMQFMEDVYKNHFPDKKIKLPRESPVPLPELTISDEDIPLSKVLGSAMEAEQSAHDYYKSLSKRFPEDTKLNNILLYFADMELGHYKILEIEKESMERFEEDDVYWPMVHVGP